MDKSEVINAITMLPGFYLGYQFYQSNPYKAASYMLICFGSIIHHMWRSVGGDDRYTFRLDLTCQQVFSFVCMNQNYQNIYRVRACLVLLTCISLRLSTVYDDFVLFFINLIMCMLCVGNNTDALGKLVIVTALFLCGKTHYTMRAIFHPVFHLYVHVFILSCLQGETNFNFLHPSYIH